MPTFITDRPSAQGAGNDNNWTIFGAAPNKWTALADDTDASGVNPDLGTSSETYDFPTPSIPVGSVIISIKLIARCATSSLDTVQLRARLGGVVVQSPVFGYTGTFPVAVDQAWLVPRPGGGPWQIADLVSGSLQLGWDHHNWSVHATPGDTELKRQITYLPAGVQQEPVRTTASRILSRHGSTPDRYAIPVNAELLRLDLGQELSLQHQFVPRAEGYGAGSLPWQREWLRVFGRKLDLNTMAVELHTEALREVIHQFQDSGVSPREPSGLRDGVLILDPGTTRTNDGPAIVVRSPVSGLYIQTVEDVEAVTDEGRLHEGEATNRFLNSAFVNGLTSWTTSGGGSVTLDTTDPGPWDPSITTQHAKITFALGDGFISQASLTADSGWHNVSFLHYEESASHIPFARIQRASDSKYWRASDGTWQAGVTDNALPNRLAWTRDSVVRIDQTAGNTTYTASLRVQTAGHVAHAAHAQIEQAATGKGWVSSPIVTLGAAVTRAASSLKNTNNRSASILDTTRGTYLALFKTLWNSADLVGGALLYLWSCVFDGNNDVAAWYDPTADPGKLVLRWRAGGTTYTAEIVQALTAGTIYTAGFTWQSTDGENGDPSYTIGATLDGLTMVKTTTAALTMTASADLFRGSLDGTQKHLNGLLYDEHVMATVWTLPEIRRWMMS